MIICPTVTANNTYQYREQIERVENFAKVLHLDFMDGKFVQTRSPGLSQFWYPKNVRAHVHLMAESPMELVNQVIKLKPELVIIHAESDMSQAAEAIVSLKKQKIKTGVALLPETEVDEDEVFGMLSLADHALIFSGHLGYHGGKADLSLLKKVKQLKDIFPSIEVGWDGGVNAGNIKELAENGVDVANVGSYIQHSPVPEQAYEKLVSTAS